MFFKIILCQNLDFTHTCKHKKKTIPILLKLLSQNIQQLWVQGEAIYSLKVNFAQENLSSIRMKGGELEVEILAKDNSRGFFNVNLSRMDLKLTFCQRKKPTQVFKWVPPR